MSLGDMFKALKGRLENITITKDSERATKELEALQQKIKAEESTGNNLQDFCIVHYGQFEDRYLSYIDDKLKKNLNGLVLTLKEDEYLVGCPGALPPREIPRENLRWNKVYNLGILKHLHQWDVSDGSLVLLTPGYLKKINHSEWSEQTGNMAVRLGHLAHSDPNISSCGFDNDQAGYRSRFSLRIGDEVEQYLRQVMPVKTNEIFSRLGYVPGIKLEHDKPKKKDNLKM